MNTKASRVKNYFILVILLWYTVSKAPTSCISNKLYRTVVNIKTELLEKNLQLDILGRFKRILGQTDYEQEGQYWNFKFGFFLLMQLSRVNDTGCWSLLADTVVKIKICLNVMPSYKNKVGLWNFRLLQYFYQAYLLSYI